MTKSEVELAKNVKTGFRSPGSTMAMPPKGGDAGLGEAEIRAVLKFMKESFATGGE